MSFNLHPQLIADCYVLGRDQHCQLLLHKNASLPWFIIVPETEQTEFLLLDSALQTEILWLASQLSDFMRNHLGVKKTNMATIGNIVSQLHMHVIGRSEQDACWPLPVWGHLNTQTGYTESTVIDYTEILCCEYGLTAAVA